MPLSWTDGYRIVSSREAPIAAFSGLVENPADLEELLGIEAITNPLARLAQKGIADIAPEERVIEGGAALIMPPFVIPTVSRFSDGSYGVFYAGDELKTAGEERAYHLAGDLKKSHESEIVLRAEGYAYKVGLDGQLHDVRRSADPPPPPGVYNPNNYAIAQQHGRSLRRAGANGLLYESVRRPGFECVGIFRPKCVRDPRPAGVVYFDWDGQRVSVSVDEPRNSIA
ncbi:MAG: RES family NAD+ phosphorylase [Vulcanimicrobiaceae bacterium]